LPEIIQEIGAYAGLASVVGLAVLSALYFSQARDVKRLREWAGRAPERAEQGVPAVPGRMVAPQPEPQPQPKPEAAPEPARPAAPPVPSPAAAAVASGAPPAAVTAAAAAKPAAVPAGNSSPAAAPAAPAESREPAPVGAPSGPGPATAVASSKAATKAPPVPAKAPAPGSAGGNAGSRPPAPPVPRPPGPPRPVSQPTAIMAPPRTDPWYRRLLASPVYMVLTIAGVLIIGGAIAFGVSQLVSDDETGAGGASAGGEPRVAGNESGGEDRPRGRRRGGAINPATVKVATLNGTTVPGLAATLNDQVEEAGFEGGTIANFTPNQQLAESVVQYTPGHEREAAAVGRRLDIAQREPASPSSQELAGGAIVIVLVGADKAP
jgi:hypothetical protein